MPLHLLNIVHSVLFDFQDECEQIKGVILSFAINSQLALSKMTPKDTVMGYISVWCVIVSDFREVLTIF